MDLIRTRFKLQALSIVLFLAHGLMSCDYNAEPYGCRYSVWNVDPFDIGYVVFWRGDTTHQEIVLSGEKLNAVEVYDTFTDISDFHHCSYFADSILVYKESTSEIIRVYHNENHGFKMDTNATNMFVEEDHIPFDFKPNKRGETGLLEYIFALSEHNHNP